ncbi:1885_t:CDS:2 [Entrophospora sp. SA101]|nr:833_t:CDS:2 [Entrophospora sp. SA101]CAJ0828173.1 1885_t:CDS:2 [Entrophospora sp. SA101]
MDFAARNAVNLSVLKRHDEYIVEIIDTSSHVVVYLFDRDQSTWTKKGVEGTISIQPVFGFIVMNRLGLDNFMAPLVDNMDLEFKDEYIIYRTDDDVIHGIWIFEPKDRDRIGKSMKKCRELSLIITLPPQLSLNSSSKTTITTSKNQKTSEKQPTSIPNDRHSKDLLELFNIKTPPPPKRNIIDDLPRRYHTPPAITVRY